MIDEINRQRTTILLVEQNAAMALSIAHRGYVLVARDITQRGWAAELQERRDARRTHLGVGT